MYCRYCGKLVKEDVVYCNYCGKKIGDLDEIQSDIKSAKTIVAKKCLVCGRQFEDGDIRILLEDGGSICEDCYSAFGEGQIQNEDEIQDKTDSDTLAWQTQAHEILKIAKKKGHKIKRKLNKWYLLYIIPIVILAIILIKVNSIKGHWYLTNAEEVGVYSNRSTIFSEPSTEVYFNENGSFSNTDTGSILGTYRANDGILTLIGPQGDIYTLGYKIKWGKLYLYYGNKECVYSRILKMVDPESVKIARLICTDDNKDMMIYNTDLTGKTFVTDGSTDDPQYKYGVRIQLNDERKRELADYMTEHFNHLMEINPEGGNMWRAEINVVITDGNIFIYYSDDEAEAREFYDTIK